MELALPRSRPTGLLGRDRGSHTSTTAPNEPATRVISTSPVPFATVTGLEGSSSGTERATLLEFLDYQREALIARVDGLTDEQSRMTPTASSLSLLRLIKHSAIWERRWFQIIAAGRMFPGEWPAVPVVEAENVDTTFRLTNDDTIETVVADYREQIVASNEILGSLDLDAPCARSDKVNENVRWVAVHMIEETARHAGHADIIRETIDGTRGR